MFDTAGSTTRDAVLEPVRTGERLLTLDVLRGLALLGVIIANMQWFSGLIFRFPGYRQDLQGVSLDSVVYHAVAIVVSGKAIATLSFLFGLGFAIQLVRAEQRGVSIVPIYCRRLLVLLAIGVVHLVFIWYGDILSLYAVLGFALLWGARRSDRTLLTSAAIFLIALPLALGLSASLSALGDTASAAAAPGPSRAEANEATLATFRDGTYPQIVRENVIQNLQFFEGARGFTNLEYLGLFLVGLYAGRRRLLEPDVVRDTTLRRVAVWGIVIGLCGGVVDVTVAILVGRRAAFLRPDLALVMNLVAITTFAQAAGYVATVMLLLRRPFWQRWLAAFAPAGRMALTNYLTQSVACVTIFVGFGLIGTMGPAAGLALALAIYGTQMAVSHLWLSSFRMGPMEWVWRVATYGVPVAVAGS